MAGTIHQISISDGGVPKRAVPAAEIGLRGVLGDRQADRKHHGSSDRALCLSSLDVIDALRAEGHPIAPGAAGENLTLAGIDWESMAPGVRLRIGDEVEAEVTAPATPCHKIAGCFADRDPHHLSHQLHPGRSRWYAKVLRGGRVATGDTVTIEP